MHVCTNRRVCVCVCVLFGSVIIMYGVVTTVFYGDELCLEVYFLLLILILKWFLKIVRHAMLWIAGRCCYVWSALDIFVGEPRQIPDCISKSIFWLLLCLNWLGGNMLSDWGFLLLAVDIVVDGICWCCSAVWSKIVELVQNGTLICTWWMPCTLVFIWSMLYVAR